MPPIRSQDLGTMMSVDQAGERISASRRTVYRLMAEGELEYTQVGTRRRITERSVLDYLNRNASPAARNHKAK